MSDTPRVEPPEDATEQATVPTEVAPIEGPSRGRRLLRVVRDWGLTLVAIVVVVQVVGWWRAPDLPEMAPAFSLEDLDGNTVSLDQLRGRTVVLNFWAEWCMPCRAEIPSFSKFAQNNPEIAVYGIAADGSPEQVREAAADLGIDYPVLLADRATLAAYSVETLPTTVVVGPDGDVRYAHSGIMLGPQIAFAVRQ